MEISPGENMPRAARGPLDLLWSDFYSGTSPGGGSYQPLVQPTANETQTHTRSSSDPDDGETTQAWAPAPATKSSQGRSDVGYKQIVENEAEQPSTARATSTETSNSQIWTRAHEDFEGEQILLPRANVYRAHALGLDAMKGTKKATIYTVLIVFIQVLGGFFVLSYSHRYWRRHNIEPLWQYLQDQYQERGDDSSLPFWQWLMVDEDCGSLIQRKILGVAFILMLFLHYDTALQEQEYELQVIPVKKEKWFWLWTDCLCRGMTSLLVGLSTGTLLNECGTVPEVILDSVGLLFLCNLDQLDTGISYGVTEELFHRVVKDKYCRFSYLANLGEMIESRHRLKICAKLFRLLNLVTLCIQTAIFATLVPKHELEAYAGICGRGNYVTAGLCKMGELMSHWIWLSILILLGLIGLRLVECDCNDPWGEYDRTFTKYHKCLERKIREEMGSTEGTPKQG